jgi:hypothetical protein
MYLSPRSCERVRRMCVLGMSMYVCAIRACLSVCVCVCVCVHMCVCARL